MENLATEELQAIYQVFLSLNVKAADENALEQMRIIKSIQKKMKAALKQAAEFPAAGEKENA